MRVSPRWLMVALVAAGVIGSEAAAAEPIRLANDPALSPDGSLLVFAWQGDLWSVSSSGGTARRLTFHPAQESDPAFSPDGTSLAFISDREGSAQVYRMPAAGGAPQQLTFHTEGYGVEGWYPDGSAVLVSSTRDHFWRRAERLFRIEVDPPTTAAERLVFNDFAGQAQVSPDGLKILFTREGERWWRNGYRGARASQIWLYDVKSGKFTPLIPRTLGPLTDQPESRWPLWNEDGSEFYYVGTASRFVDETKADRSLPVGSQGKGFVKTPEGGQSPNLCVYNVASKKSRQLTDFEDAVTFPTISRNGTVIVFRTLFDLYRFEPGSSQPPVRLDIVHDDDATPSPIVRRELSKATDVAFSRDGLDVAFIAGGDVWVMDTELREPVPVTSTPEEERDLVFSPDGNRLLYVSLSEGTPDIWQAERSDHTKYWWQNRQFQTKRLTQTAANESGLSFSPDGKQVGFVRERGDLYVMQADGSNARQILSGFDRPAYEFSPDGRWIAYSRNDADFNRDIWIVPVDGSRAPENISRHPDSEFDPRWSPDGKLLAFTGRRVGEEIDVYYVWLQAAEDDKSQRDRRVESALEKLTKARKAKPPSKSDPTAAPPVEPSARDEAGQPDRQPATEESRTEQAADKPDSSGDVTPEIRIDFDGIHDRLHRISIPHSSEANLFWSHDSKKLAFTATIDGNEGTYTVETPFQDSPKRLTSKKGTSARWLKDGNHIVWLADGLPGSVSATGVAATYSFSAFQEFDRGARYQAGFDVAWMTLRDRWYDERHGNRNWEEVRFKYRPLAGQVTDDESFTTIVQLMLGELNGSHLGFTPARSSDSSTPVTKRPDDWQIITPHLGVRFDETHPGPGLKISDVIQQGPADKSQSRLHPGEILLSVDGTAVDPTMDLARAITGRLERDLQLTVRAADGTQREVTLRPVTYTAVRALLYDQWVAHNREQVEQLSDGRLGYIHITAMNEPSFHEFDRQLYAVGYGKEGLVIDVRENGGGSTTDHLLTALTQPVHAITVPRGGEQGYPQDRKVYASWSKPIVVMCNQNSYSNAEIFSHAIKTLKRGKLVGVPTAGGVISTGTVQVMDLGTLRLPSRGWFVLESGEDMERHGAVPNVIVWPQPGELPAGIDTQLTRAVKVLEQSVATWKKRPPAKPLFATERD